MPPNCSFMYFNKFSLHITAFSCSGFLGTFLLGCISPYFSIVVLIAYSLFLHPHDLIFLDLSSYPNTFSSFPQEHLHFQYPLPAYSITYNSFMYLPFKSINCVQPQDLLCPLTKLYVNTSDTFPHNLHLQSHLL